MIAGMIRTDDLRYVAVRQVRAFVGIVDVRAERRHRRQAILGFVCDGHERFAGRARPEKREAFAPRAAAIVYSVAVDRSCSVHRLRLPTAYSALIWILRNATRLVWDCRPMKAGAAVPEQRRTTDITYATSNAH